MVRNGLSKFKGKRILLLQGPMGPFFHRLALDLTQAGAQVFKVNFNGGDWLFYSENSLNYRGKMEQWPAYFEDLLAQLHVDVVMLFGDCRPIHCVAHEIAHRHGLEIGVFEEGYIRPDYITLEQYGVNENSPLPRSPVYYLNSPPANIESPQPVGNTYWYAVLWAILYYFVAGLSKPIFPHYHHHRTLSWLEALPWLRSLWRKWYFAIKERGTLALLTEKYSGRYFLVPLQVHNDAQVVQHSGFDTVRHFINEVMVSFASHAPRNKILVIKHHPMDRGYFDYTKFINEKMKSLGLQGRCLYIHDQRLPTLLDHSTGVVVVNSTVGLSALIHGAPVKVCGKSLYDMKGLTFQHSLGRFWREAQHAKPNARLLRYFYDYLVSYSQINGSFYKRLPIVASATGLLWVLNDDVAVAKAGAQEKRA